MRSGRGRSTLEAPLDLKRSCDIAALWNLDRGSGRTRRHTEHRIRPGDPCWNVHVYRGKPCRQARALSRSYCERCILIRKDFSARSTRYLSFANPCPLRHPGDFPESKRLSRRHSYCQNQFPLKYPSRSYPIALKRYQFRLLFSPITIRHERASYYGTRLIVRSAIYRIRSSARRAD